MSKRTLPEVHYKTCDALPFTRAANYCGDIYEILESAERSAIAGDENRAYNDIVNARIYFSNNVKYSKYFYVPADFDILCIDCETLLDEIKAYKAQIARIYKAFTLIAKGCEELYTVTQANC